MTLQSSGPLTLAEIETEFGGAGEVRLNEYYAGGSYVPAGTSGDNGPIPSSGRIQISDFYGAADEVIISDPDIDFYITTGNGPQPDVFANADRARGYTRVWEDGDYSYGSASNGRFSDEGWGIDSVILIMDYRLVGGNDAYGFLINFSDDLWQNRFTFTLSGYAAGPDGLDSNNADTDSTVYVNHSGGAKNVRSLWWSFGGGYGPFINEWDAGTDIDVAVSREN